MFLHKSDGLLALKLVAFPHLLLVALSCLIFTVAVSYLLWVACDIKSVTHFSIRLITNLTSYHGNITSWIQQLATSVNCFLSQDTINQSYVTIQNILYSLKDTFIWSREKRYTKLKMILINASNAEKTHIYGLLVQRYMCCSIEIENFIQALS